MKKPLASKKKQAENLDEGPISSSRWETLMEKLDQAWAANRIDLHTYQILLEAVEEAERTNSGQDVL